MNVKLHYKLNFCSGVFFNETTFLNNYEIELDLITASSNGYEQNVALDRVKFFVEHVCNGSFFINDVELKQIKALLNANLNVIALPEDPIDQIIGIMLYHKLNAIMEGRMLIYRLSINSELGDFVSYIHSDDESSGPFDVGGWWNEPEMICNNFNNVKEKTKIVKIVPTRTWADLNLDWEKTEEDDDPSGAVVFVNFKKE
jgi:hypothetical protein